jgi:hypothetical protein
MTAGTALSAIRAAGVSQFDRCVCIGASDK